MSFTEELIEAVRHERVLYVTSHPDYTRGTYMDEIWATIASTLQLKDGKYRLLLFVNTTWRLGFLLTGCCIKTANTTWKSGLPLMMCAIASCMVCVCV